MALVVLLRGVNVGGRRTFRPSQLSAELKHLDAVNIGAAGTFVIRKSIGSAALRAEFARRLPFETEIMICEGRDIVRLISAVAARDGSSENNMSEPTSAIASRLSAVPSGTEFARPFLPARDFELSKKFYETVGFEKLLDSSDVAIFRAGSGGFLLQRRYEEDWAENCMMQLMVDDLDSWWAHILSLDLPGRFGVQPPKGPAVQPWGLRVAYLFDPCGVLWHVAQRRDGVAHD